MAAIKQPADKSHFILPDLGEGVHEAELIKWRVKPGDNVAEHQTLAEMETDKALVEVPSPWSGVIKELKGNEGDILKVGSILVTYNIGEASSAAQATPSAEGQSNSKSQAGIGHGARASSSKSASAPVEREASAASSGADREDAGTVVGNVSGSLAVPARFARRTLEHEAPATGRAMATPAVRRIARELGIDINRVPASGRGGRVTAGDVQNFVNGAGDTSRTMRSVQPMGDDDVNRGAIAPIPTPSSDGVAQRIPFRGVRRKIAQALSQSIHTAVHFTVVDEADITALDRKRAEYSAVVGRKLSVLPFLIIAVCKALRKHPSINANVDDRNEEILEKSVINLGCAVDTDHGLMVPVIANADRLSIVQLSDAVLQLAAACRNRTIAREQLTGGTFTISNVGSYGGMFATPIINYPEVAIIAAGRAKEQVLVRNGSFFAGKVLPLSMSCDHRVVDGAEGARFLNTVVKLLESPEGLVG